MRVLNFVDRLIDNIGKVVSFTLIAIMLILVYAVIMRYVFNDSPEWTHETSLFLYGGLGMMLGGYTLLRRSHVRMDLIYNMLSPRKRAILDSITAPLFFLLIILLIWQGWETFRWSWLVEQRTDSMWHPLIWPAKLAIPIGAGLLLLMGTVDFVRNVYFSLKGKKLDEH